MEGHVKYRMKESILLDNCRGGGGGGGQEGGLITDHRDLKHKITNHRVFK